MKKYHFDFKFICIYILIIAVFLIVPLLGNRAVTVYSDNLTPRKCVIIDAGHGEESNPNIVGSLMGWMCERCGEVQIGNEWICHDPYVQKDHAQDPFDAFTRPTSNRSIYDFIQMMLTIEGTQWAKKVPKKLPIYNIAGDQDPVGEYGLGVCQVSNWLVETGHHLTTKLYSGYRHEIHNYPEIKNEVEAGIIKFMNSNL